MFSNNLSAKGPKSKVGVKLKPYTLGSGEHYNGLYGSGNVSNAGNKKIFPDRSSGSCLFLTQSFSMLL